MLKKVKEVFKQAPKRISLGPDGIPYEIFTGPKDLDVFPIPSSVTEGVIIKVKQEEEHSRYDFRYIDSWFAK